jgi:hypothetical protein
MKLYHFTSNRHLYGIGRHGLTVGDVPTDIRSNKGRCGVWLTTAGDHHGHGLEGSTADKSQFRLTVNAPETSALVRWVDWAPKNASPDTIRVLHATAPGFETWYVFFGVIDRSAIAECIDVRTGKFVEDWHERPPSPLDVEPVPPMRRNHWHKKLLKETARAIAAARFRASSG